MKRAGMLLAGLIAALPALGQDDAKKIVECLRAAVPPHLAIGRVELTTFDRGGGARTVKGRLYTRREPPGHGLIQATLRIDAPDELRGAAYHVRETSDYLRDGMFVYLPAVKRVRRITGSFADGALLGTNFSYFDFKQLQSAFGDLGATLEGMDPVNGRPAYVLRFKTLEGTETRYSGVRAWVDRDACVTVRADFFEGAKVVKELTSPEGSLKRADNVWYVAQYEMRDPIAGTRTVLQLGRLDGKTAPSPRHFDPTSFFQEP